MKASTKVSLAEQLARAEVGDVIYTDVKDTAIGSYTKRAGVQASTQRVIAILGKEREVIDLTQITILRAASGPAPAPTARASRKRQAL